VNALKAKGFDTGFVEADPTIAPGAGAGGEAGGGTKPGAAKPGAKPMARR